MFKRILIANRGEIAVRIIRACREMGITSVTVHSTADRDSLHTELADESICIGPAGPADSYLKIPSIIAAAEIADVEAIHPGYGFLAESARFAAICRESRLAFIGPSVEALAMSADKVQSRKKMVDAGVPVVPGSNGIIEDADAACALAKEIGYPVLVKAAAGGGGRGMRIAHNESTLKHALSVASTEATNAFDNGSIYIEKFIDGGRHIEFQILGDQHGNLICLGERECTIQRRHQKLIEETPSTALTPALREAMTEAALAAAKAVDYSNAGTVEFLLDRAGNFYFIELNARIQVEHPVTEEAFCLDLVREQIRLASGEILGYDAPAPSFHVIEARVYAEDPDLNFRPNSGLIKRCHIPGGPGIRVDTHLFSGYEVPHHYDSLLAKVIARGNTRTEAIERLSRALNEFFVDNVTTTAKLCARIVSGQRFRRGEIGPDLLAEYLDKDSR
ncbi:MAG: acetyl-CoA carboxylase biotin carboxylase subunit [Candidatus Hydrogenedentes bacterium]|nr:acetyl-CoA carboxylase biotin carboxylase subunit [Candidatus Hydrogenedentota bacterium]